MVQITTHDNMKVRTGQTNISKDEQELHSSIEVLSGEVSRLEDKKTEIENIISNFDENEKSFKEKQIALEEMISHITAKQIIVDSLSIDIDTLVVKKKSLQEENTILDISVEKKKEYIADIERYERNLQILQKDSENFLNQSSETKKRLESEILKTKSNLKELHDKIGTIIN